MAKKFPIAIPIEETPLSLYFKILTLNPQQRDAINTSKEQFALEKDFEEYSSYMSITVPNSPTVTPKNWSFLKV